MWLLLGVGVAAVLVVALVVAVVMRNGSDDLDAAVDAGGSTTSAPTTEASEREVGSGASSSTTNAPSTTPQTTAGPTTSSAVAPLRGAPARSGEWDGSGCMPGPGPLPDGWWFGYVVQTSGPFDSATSFEFDLACLATTPGTIESDTFRTRVSNQNPDSRVVELATEAVRTPARCLGATGFEGDDYGFGQRDCSGAEVLARSASNATWVQVEGGVAVGLAEQLAIT